MYGPYSHEIWLYFLHDFYDAVNYKIWYQKKKWKKKKWKFPSQQLPLNTPKNWIEKPHLRSVIFWNSTEISLFFQCKRSLQSRRYYSGFWSRGTWPSAESPDRGPRHNGHYTCTVKGREKSRMRTTYQNISMRFGFFRACAFSCQKPWMLWVFLAV